VGDGADDGWTVDVGVLVLFWTQPAKAKTNKSSVTKHLLTYIFIVFLFNWPQSNRTSMQ
jgi:hypothetical protein